MQNQEFYIKYLDNRPVGLKTHILNTNSFLWIQTLFTVGDLIGAFQGLANSPLASVFVGDLTLHFPDAFDRSALQEECFSSIDETDTSLDPGCLLCNLVSLALNSKQPLIIKSINNAGKGMFSIGLISKLILDLYRRLIMIGITYKISLVTLCRLMKHLQ